MAATQKEAADGGRSDGGNLDLTASMQLGCTRYSYLQ